MQLYVNVLIAQSRLHHAVHHTSMVSLDLVGLDTRETSLDERSDILEMIRLYRGALTLYFQLLTRQSECHHVLKFEGPEIFSSDDCKITLWLVGLSPWCYLLLRVCVIVL